MDMTERSLGRPDWLRAARRALLKGGVDAVRVTRLAKTLRVTKGSFYWHWKDRGELLEALLREWEDELSEILAQMAGAAGPAALSRFLQVVVEHAAQSEAGEGPSDAAIFGWAAVSPAVARRVNRAEEERLKLLARLTGDPLRGEVLYLAWLGVVARGKRLPGSRQRFPEIAAAMLSLFPPSPSLPLPLPPSLPLPLPPDADR
jgi:AcrR family transcriptional regulator